MTRKQTGHEKEPLRHTQMTVEEAGRMGGHKGGQRVKELIEEGKRAERGDAGEEMVGAEDKQEEEDGEA